MRSLILAGFLALLAAGSARADDPPTVGILEALRLEPAPAVDGLAYVSSLPCTVREGSPLEVFEPGDAVFLSSGDRGSFRVVPDTQGVLACVVGETVHVLDFVSPRHGLLALGLEPSDEPIADGDILPTRVVDPERLTAHGIASHGVGARASVWGRSRGWWRVSTYGEGLQELGIRYVPPDTPVLLERGAGSAWTLTLLAPGFTVERLLAALDLADLGLSDPRLLDLPVGGTVRGRIGYRWKAKEAGLEGLRGRELVEVVCRPDSGYRMRSRAPRRAVSIDLP